MERKGRAKEIQIQKEIRKLGNTAGCFALSISFLRSGGQMNLGDFAAKFTLNISIQSARVSKIGASFCNYKFALSLYCNNEVEAPTPIYHLSSKISLDILSNRCST